MFKHGKISLRQRAFSEKIFWNIIHQIAKNKIKLKHAPPELEDIESAIADIYYCNFSVFQSIPDSWAIDQLFPIMPLHRLLEMPGRNAVLADITCDCDGKIDKFIDLHDVRHTLPVHDIKTVTTTIWAFSLSALTRKLWVIYTICLEILMWSA